MLRSRRSDSALMRQAILHLQTPVPAQPLADEGFLDAAGLSAPAGAYRILPPGVTPRPPASDPIPDSVETTSILAVNGAMGTSLIEAPYDHDWWQVTLTVGTAYTFSMGANGGTLNSYLLFAGFCRFSIGLQRRRFCRP